MLVDRYWPRGVSKEELLEVHRQGTLILVYGARDTEHNNAEALRSYLQERARGN